MPTYNKFANNDFADCTHLLEEAIEAFLRQDYPHKELILCNDCPVQTYACDAPGVVVINLPRRCRSLGEKLNFMASIAKGEILGRWDDDDIFFHWRLSVQVEALQKYHYVTSSNSWWYYDYQYHYNGNRGQSQVAFRRELFDKLRGFPFISYSEDMEFEHAANAADPNKFHVIPVTQSSAYSMIRWGTGSQHVSGYGEEGYEIMSQTQARPGHKVLRPHWRVDYVAKVGGVCPRNSRYGSTVPREISWPQPRSSETSNEDTETTSK